MSLNTIPSPISIEFTLWCNQLIQNFPNQTIPFPPPVKYWRGWAENLRLNPFFSPAPIPDKKQFKTDESWRDWGTLFKLMMGY